MSTGDLDPLKDMASWDVSDMARKTQQVNPPTKALQGIYIDSVSNADCVCSSATGIICIMLL